MIGMGPGRALILKRPSLAAAATVCAAALLAMAVLRLGVYGDRFVALPYGLMLLVALWHRDRRLLWGMVVVLAAIVAIKLTWLLSVQGLTDAGQVLEDAALIGAELIAMAGVLHWLLAALDRLEGKNEELERANAELEASNEELAAREEEIAQQNEELQAQAEELERQSAELEQHAEELEQQGAELQDANEELARRERGLQTLLESTRWLSGDMNEYEVLSKIAEAAVQMLAPDAVAAVIVKADERWLTVRGAYGLRREAMRGERWPMEHSFAAVVMERERTAYIADLRLRPDLSTSVPERETFRTQLASPLRVHGRVCGAIKVFGSEPREWTAEQFRVLEWLAAQGSLVLEAVELQRELNARRQEAEEASRRKTRFLAAVSHDVRTPANAIGLMAELLCRSAEDPARVGEVPELARELQASARSLVDLVSDVLDVTRFDTGKLELQAQRFEVGSVMQSSVRQLLPIAIGKGIRLEASSPDAGIWVSTDRMKLARVVDNLVGNAVKFTETGGVRVGWRRDPADGSVVIEVADTGVGIAPEHQARIFDEFVQLRNPARDRSKGTGLGLAICKRILDAMGCRIDVESRPNEGSTFRVRLPGSMVVADGPRTPGPAGTGLADRRASGLRGRLEGLTVLLVEDHEATRRSTARLLSAEGAAVVQAENGRAALHALMHEQPDALLLDLMLPDMEGTRILEHLRSARPDSLRCILAVSGDVSEERVGQVTRLGAQGLVAKPVDMAQLVGRLERTVRVRPADGGVAVSGERVEA